MLLEVFQLINHNKSSNLIFSAQTGALSLLICESLYLL